MDVSGGTNSLAEGSGAVCTLFEGDYHFGLAALANSLVRAGFAGTIWAGYRGPLPPWLDQLRRENGEGEKYLVSDQVRLAFIPLETDWHFTNYKPQFMLNLLDGEARSSKYLWYFDPDIFLRCKWSYFEGWQNHGIALCEEIVNYNLAENSVLRLQWVESGIQMKLGEARRLGQYFNGGMVGVPSAYIDFLNLWKHILKEINGMGYDLRKSKPTAADMPFSATDQDALNMAAMYTNRPLATMGPEAMGFVPSGFTMYHAVGRKPWRGSLLLRALAGEPPSGATKFYFTQVSSPIRVYSSVQLYAKLLASRMATFIGRFYRRAPQ